jgi:serine/threonine protein kinase
MPPQLLVISGPDQGRSFALIEGQPLVIGRGEAATARLSDAHVSRRHCQAIVEEGRFFVEDAGSSGGTLVNGQPITKQEICPGDVVRIGGTELRFLLEGNPDASTLIQPAVAPAKPKPRVTPLTEMVGRKIGCYQIQERLATGQSGMVFRAAEAKRDRTVALKVLWPETSQIDDEVRRFVRAMKTMLPIRHPNIVQLYAAGKTGPYCWLAMEYVEGESLASVIPRIGTAGMLDWRYAFRVAVHIARALEAACEHDIVHRNITPANILIRASDKVAKLGDLMLAKALAGSLARQITRAGELVGDLLYLPPERTRSQAEVDCRSDIYSLGATLYALLTGRPPFEGHSAPELIKKIREDDAEPPKKYQLSIPDLFEGVVLQMLAKRPDDRHETPRQLLKDLDRVARYQGIQV